MERLDRITSDPAMQGGEPCIRGTQCTVRMLLDLLASGATKDGILARHRELEPADIEQAIAYAKADERRSRAEARRRRGMEVERFEGFPVTDAHGTATVSERIALVAMLSRAAFLASGRQLVQIPRSEWPGEILDLDDEHARRAP